MFLNARQYRANRGIKIYTCNRLNDTKFLTFTNEVKATTDCNNNEIDASCHNMQSNNTTFSKPPLLDECNVTSQEDVKNDVIERENVSVQVKDENMNELVILEESNWMNEDKDSLVPTNDDSDFKKWLMSSELGKEKSKKVKKTVGKAAKFENSNLDKASNDKENMNENEFVKNGDLRNGGHGKNEESIDQVENGKILQPLKSTSIVNGIIEHELFESSNTNNSYVTLENGDIKSNGIDDTTDQENLGLCADGKDLLYLNDFNYHVIAEDEFKIVNYKKKPKAILNGNGCAMLTNEMAHKNTRDHRSFRRPHNRPHFNRNHRSSLLKNAQKIPLNDSHTLQERLIVEKNSDLEVKTNVCGLDAPKRTYSEGQSSLSSSSSTLSDNPSSPSTLSSSPSPQPPSPNSNLDKGLINDNLSSNDESTKNEDILITNNVSNSLSYKSIIDGLNNDRDKTLNEQGDTILPNSSSNVWRKCNVNTVKCKEEMRMADNKKAHEKVECSGKVNKTNKKGKKYKTHIIDNNSLQSDYSSLDSALVNRHQNDNLLSPQESDLEQVEPLASISTTNGLTHESESPSSDHLSQDATKSLQSNIGRGTKIEKVQKIKVFKPVPQRIDSKCFNEGAKKICLLDCKENVIKKGKLNKKIFNLKQTQSYLMQAFEDKQT